MKIVVNGIDTEMPNTNTYIFITTMLCFLKNYT